MKCLPLLLLAVAASPAMSQTVAGPATVIDGDTILVSNTKVRLFSIDAPEAGQTCNRDGAMWNCGAEATRQLSALVGSATVVCQSRGIDDYRRTLAVCSAGQLNLNATMVEEGWATAYRKYSDDYGAQEYRARAERRGIWSSSFDLPETFRLAQRSAHEERSAPAGARPAPTHQSSPGCVINGNRSRRGEWIYHMPGQQYYERTRPEEIFCSEAQARAAGYRRSKV